MVKGEPGLAFTPCGKVLAKGKGEMEMYFGDVLDKRTCGAHELTPAAE